ncbi:cob(I)yrinic acid a,c-diamide adenosyltransferase [Desulfogranum mediterraneum]|uniref:cob(I)yrinic acid a,c-diamide adenosyltransferase n=1 Tax=Desulfogranum mediterraneum TaxID=160661 RepID=UPI0004208C0A|nr:cob(I)yrinic acid a,c-diamide adenosyltransferase [Desulfogranum mediterraneum]
MKVYTGGGDKGKTSLFSGERVAKHSLRIESYGDLDELNSLIGAVLAVLPDNSQLVARELAQIQARLFQAGAWLATTADSSASQFLDPMDESLVSELEGAIDTLSEELPPLKVFILPGGHQSAALAHVARTVCRRCERRASQLVEELEAEGELDAALSVIAVYLNRLSDYLFVAARYLNKVTATQEQAWQKP